MIFTENRIRRERSQETVWIAILQISGFLQHSRIIQVNVVRVPTRTPDSNFAVSTESKNVHGSGRAQIQSLVARRSVLHYSAVITDRDSLAWAAVPAGRYSPGQNILNTSGLRGSRWQLRPFAQHFLPPPVRSALLDDGLLRQEAFIGSCIGLNFYDCQ